MYSDLKAALKHAQTPDDTPAMRTLWNQTVLDRLVRNASPGGGFGYRPLSCAAPEPTALACLALHANDDPSPLISESLKRLAREQQKNGSIPVDAATPSATWPTSITILAWCMIHPERYQRNITAAMDYLLTIEGKTFRSDPHIYGHDTTLVGWPWIEQTHTWLEPTSYALLALRTMAMMDHPRARNALRVIYDRAIPSGGWNYGNSRMFQNPLRAFPSTTGIVLTALTGQKKDTTIERAVAFLLKELPLVRSPFSLAWGVIGLRCWDALPDDALRWMQTAITRDRLAPPSPLEDALMLLASAPVNLFAAHSQQRGSALFSQTGASHA